MAFQVSVNAFPFSPRRACFAEHLAGYHCSFEHGLRDSGEQSTALLSPLAEDLCPVLTRVQQQSHQGQRAGSTGPDISSWPHDGKGTPPALSHPQPHPILLPALSGPVLLTS